MTYKEYKTACLECGLVFQREIDIPILGKFISETNIKETCYAAFYENQYIVKFLDINNKPFKFDVKDDTVGVAWFPLLEDNKRILVLPGKPLNSRIFKSIEEIKKQKIKMKLKFMEEDFND